MQGRTCKSSGNKVGMKSTLGYHVTEHDEKEKLGRLHYSFCITHQKIPSYFLFRNESGSKWPPVLKLWEQLCKNHSKVSQNTYRQKAFALLLLKMPQGFCYLIFATDVVQSTLSLFFATLSSRVAQGAFYPHLVFILFTGPFLHDFSFYQKFLYLLYN